MQNLLIVPREVLQRAYDALEEIPDWSVAGSETWITYHQLGTFLYPDQDFPPEPKPATYRFDGSADWQS